MKNVYVLLMVIVLIIVSHAVKAQPAARPAQFSACPENISCTEAQLQTLFGLPVNSPVTLSLPGNFTFKGTLQSNEQPYSNLQSLIIRSTNFPGSVFSLSRISETGAPVKYAGRIISFQHSDALELQYENGVYFLQKKKFEHLIPACHQ